MLALYDAVAHDARHGARGLGLAGHGRRGRPTSFLREQLARFQRVVTVARSLTEIVLHAAKQRRNRRCGLPLRHSPLRHRGARARPFGRDPAEAKAQALGALADVALESGDSVGYSVMAGRQGDDVAVGVLPIVHGDGVRRGLTNNAAVLIGGRRYPLGGDMSMDNVTVDLGAETDCRARRRGRGQRA